MAHVQSLRGSKLLPRGLSQLRQGTCGHPRARCLHAWHGLSRGLCHPIRHRNSPAFFFFFVCYCKIQPLHNSLFNQKFLFFLYGKTKLFRQHAVLRPPPGAFQSLRGHPRECGGKRRAVPALFLGRVAPPRPADVGGIHLLLRGDPSGRLLFGGHQTWRALVAILTDLWDTWCFS